MSKSYYRSKPAAMVVTVIALSFVLPDSAVAETDTVAKDDQLGEGEKDRQGRGDRRDQ